MEWENINWKDNKIKNLIFDTYKYNKKCIEFYLEEFVFKRECSQFSHKISSNAWDVIGFNK